MQSTNATTPGHWEVKQPHIESYGILNGPMNAVIAPKATGFIKTALHDSMQRQEQMNQSLELRISQLERQISEMTALLGGLPGAIAEVRHAVALEGEIIRSELGYQIRSQNLDTQPKIMNAQKLHAHQDHLRLNLGCGPLTLPDYINVDQRELPGVDVVAGLEALPFEPGSVWEIYNAHVIEHFSDYDARHHILPYWFQLLKDGGKMVIICPDLKSMMVDYLKGELPWENLRKVTYGGQDYSGNYHYNMFTPDSLCELLIEVGFKQASVIETGRVNGLCYEMEIHAWK